MRNLIKSFVLIASFFVWLPLVGQDLVILYTNDTHSQIEPLTSGGNSGLGGMQRRANYIDSMRREHPNILLLDAGDFSQGSPYFTLFGGKVEVMLYNAMGYDVVTLGNHEFDNGHMALAEQLKEAKFEVVTANYDFSTSPLDSIVKPYTIVERGGRKIGVIGALINLESYVSKKGIVGLKYRDPTKIVEKIAKRLKRREGCSMVILLSHIGYGGEGKKVGDLEVAKASRNIDLIVGGHSHTFLEQPTHVKNRGGKEVVVTQMGAHGIFVGRIDITFNN